MNASLAAILSLVHVLQAAGFMLLVGAGTVGALFKEDLKGRPLLEDFRLAVEASGMLLVGLEFLPSALDGKPWAIGVLAASLLLLVWFVGRVLWRGLLYWIGYRSHEDARA